MSTPLPTPIPAMTGTCPACGERISTADGLARHNLHASAGERVYFGTVAKAITAGTARKLAAAALFLLAACGRTITAPEDGQCGRGSTLARMDTLTVTDTTAGVLVAWGWCVKEGR